jgi:hypothetical protein
LLNRDRNKIRRSKSKWFGYTRTPRAARGRSLEIAGGVAQETEKLVRRDVEEKRSALKFVLHKPWIT